jgi:hypothetical protein
MTHNDKVEALRHRILVEALVEVLGPQKGEKLLVVIADRLSLEERLSEVLPLHPKGDEREVNAARKQVLTEFRASLPVYMARLG